MSNSIRIRTTPNGNDNYLKIKLDQDFDFIEILSLKISQEEVYKKFCSDYGVVVGRVSVNNGFGVPNAKVSIFIPITDEDKLNPEIKGFYPYEQVTDKNKYGIRYNLLTKEVDNENPCFTPVGSLPSKREFMDNQLLDEIYCKYYKYTATTNHAGDFMLFGVPVGTYTLHVDADISDIGIASQRPYDLISQGASPKLFTSPTKFKESKNIDSLVQVKSMNAGINVIPFWGDLDECQIGITRMDIPLNHTVKPSAIFMGSIFGDKDKHSINKRCRPRKKLGLLEEQITSEGTIEMIRKTLDDTIEPYPIENGGRVIDANGAWAFQVPMNLDYVVTDEFGNLIPSDDETSGVPTRARVRFRIGMDETGGLGRLRTRAKFLVPNNPKSYKELDFDFDENTNNESFVDLYWNKIYSIKNFIPRYQTNKTVENRNFVGLKNVDNGPNTPFPYNRIDTDFSPLFFIICYIVTILTSLVVLINGALIYAINEFLIKPLNSFLGLISNIIGGIAKLTCRLAHLTNNNAYNQCVANNQVNSIAIPYIPCITLECGGDDKQTFAPGCGKSSGGFEQASKTKHIVHCNSLKADDPCTADDAGAPGAGYADCVSLVLADSLNSWEFDFYNDWVNGTLYSFLLKYKKKRKGREKFCEYDCGSGSFTPDNATDGNKNGKADNDCRRYWFLDSCTNANAFAAAKSRTHSSVIEEGLIKNHKGVLYYAPITHNGAYLMYATDIINLGGVFDCDWQGFANIHDDLVPTTYKLPPLLSEYTDDNLNRDVCGMSALGAGNTGNGLFFNINCVGLNIDLRNCLNIKHICEFGVDLDEAIEDQTTNAIISQADCIIGSNDVSDTFFRNSFYAFNINGPSDITPNYPSNNVNFNITNRSTYSDLSTTENSVEYVNFRNRQPNNDNYYVQPKGNSYFFYFGIIPGKSAVELLNSKFFTNCAAKTKDDFIVSLNQTPVTTNGGTDGKIVFEIIGGTGPFTYVWSGLNYAPSPVTNASSNTQYSINSLAAGVYTITITDALNNTITSSIIVTSPPPLQCVVIKNKNAKTSSSSDGEILISDISGGNPPYNYTVTPNTVNGTSVSTPIVANINTIINVKGDTYTVTITDSSTPVQTCVTSNILVTAPPPLVIGEVMSSHKNVTCLDGGDWQFKINVAGGTPPYSITTTSTIPGYSSPNLIQTNLKSGTYTVTVEDINNETISQIITINNGYTPSISWSSLTSPKHCYTWPPDFVVNVNDNGSPGPWTIEWSVNVNGISSVAQPDVIVSTPGDVTLTANNVITNTNGSVSFMVTSASGCTSNSLVVYAKGNNQPYIMNPSDVVSVDNVSFGPIADPRLVVITAKDGYGPQYRYSINGGPIQSSPMYLSTGNTYSVVAYDKFNCVSSADNFYVSNT